MKYLPNSGSALEEMLEIIGVKKVEDLFRSIPEELRLKRKLDLPDPKSEMEVIAEMKRLASMNGTVNEYVSFLGAGAYHHYIPTVVNALISRSEFYTAYTPYQPEVSQGTLQALFEYQTMIANLTGMDIANASLYDGASATAEALLMAERLQKKKARFLVSSSLHPEYIQTVDTYFHNLPLEVSQFGFDETGTVDLTDLKAKLDDNVGAVVIQSPNFFGCVESIDKISDIVQSKGALLIVVISEIFSLGVLEAPGNLGADIVVGEARSFGNRLNYGGPYLGMIAARSEYVRQMPGRLIGKTVDDRGQTGFVVTLSTREQHIRREKATSNICTNVALCATMAAIHMSCFGESGIKEVAAQNLSKAQYAKKALSTIKKVTFPFSAPVFNEFVVDTGTEGPPLVERMVEKRFVAGFPLAWYYPDRKNQLLIAVTEMNSKDDIDRFVESLGGVL